MRIRILDCSGDGNFARPEYDEGFALGALGRFRYNLYRFHRRKFTFMTLAGNYY